MIPNTVSALLVFLASVGPGYVYVRVVERWRPRREHSSLREAAEIVVSGSLATLLGVVVALIVAEQTSLVPESQVLVDDVGSYLVEQPDRLGLVLFTVLLVSYGMAYGVGRFQPGRGPEVFPDSAWYGTFERKLPSGYGIVATVELRDGRKVAGVVRAFTAEQAAPDERELVLMATAESPMLVQSPSGRIAQVSDQFILLRGDEIRNIAGSYRELLNGGATREEPAAMWKRCALRVLRAATRRLSADDARSRKPG